MSEHQMIRSRLISRIQRERTIAEWPNNIKKERDRVLDLLIEVFCDEAHLSPIVDSLGSGDLMFHAGDEDNEIFFTYVNTKKGGDDERIASIYLITPTQFSTSLKSSADLYSTCGILDWVADRMDLSKISKID